MFRLTDALSLPGGQRNEDLYRFTSNTVLLMDGSTGLSKDAPDAVWFGTGFADRFMEQIGKTGLLCQSVNDAISSLFKEYIKQGGTTAQGTVYPSASLLILHLSSDDLQILTVGDCAAVLFDRNGGNEPLTIYSEEVDRFDHAVLEHMQNIRKESGRDLCEIVKDEQIRAHLLENRLKMNQPDGYQILSFNMRPRTEEDLLHFDARRFSAAHLFTDGFMQLKEELSKKDCPALDGLYRKLRAEEQSDRSFNAYPRFKQGDDASALKILLS